MVTQQIDLAIIQNDNNLTFKYKNSDKIDDYTSVDIAYNELIVIMDKSDLITFRYAGTGNLFGSWNYKYINVVGGTIGLDKEGAYNQIINTITKAAGGGAKTYTISTTIKEPGFFYSYTGDDLSNFSLGDIIIIKDSGNMMSILPFSISNHFIYAYITDLYEVDIDLSTKKLAIIDSLAINDTIKTLSSNITTLQTDVTTLQTKVTNIEKQIGTIETTLKTING